MRTNLVVASVILTLVLASPGNALTAVCKNPTGRIFGVHGITFEGKAFDEADGISGATFTVLWKPSEKEAQIVSQNAGGGTPSTARALLVYETEEQITFLVLYESAVWFYSIYPGPKALIMTSHNNGMAIDSGGAVVKSYLARCDIGD
jgi:hypothetical protein